ncbi:translocation/assembly module TamB domain-containing protein [Parahaliea mediterranea]|uniref:translocation/assembly module TamB domain-containing protein n=1 Tax=Parahaliea mediterranea TaxID=651086 RepID=UPI000E2FA012|nr:translocation/assembly module TamB domain-containing protein [Parahaliea mediterranea]
MKRLLALLPLLLVGLLTALLALPLTEGGSRALVGLLGRYTPLQVDYGGGSLYGRFRLKSLRLNAGDVAVEVRGVNAAVRAACLVQGQLCFEHLAVQHLQVVVAEGEADAATGDAVPDPAPDTTPLLFPLRVLAPRIELAGLAVQWPGGRWEQAATLLSARMETTGIYINGARIRGARLSVEPGDDGGAERIALPPIWLPFELAIDDLELVQTRWNLAGQAGELARASLQGRWLGPQLQLAEARLQHTDWGEAGLAGEVRFAGDWPLNVKASVVANPALPGMAELQPGPLAVSASGDLSALALAIDGTAQRQLRLRATVDALDPALAFELEGQLAWPGALALSSLVALPEDAPAVLLASPLSLSLHGDVQQQQLLAAAKASGLGYEGVALVLEGQVQGQGSAFRLDSLSAQESGPQGSALFATGQLQLGQAPSLALAINSPGLTLPALSDYLFGRVQGDLTVAATLADSGWTLALQHADLSGEVNGLPATVTGSLSADSERYLSAGQLDFDVNGARGSLRAGAQNGSGSVLSLSVADLSRWRRDSRGSLSLNATLNTTTLNNTASNNATPNNAASGNAPKAAPQAALASIDFEATAEDIAWQQTTLEQGSAKGRFNLADGGAIDGGAIDATVLLRGLKQGDLLLYRNELALSGRGEHYQLNWQSRGDIEGELSLSAQRSLGSWQDWRATLAATEIKTPLGPWALAQPVALDVKGGELSVAPHCWRQAATALCVQQANIGASGALALNLKGDAALLEQFASDGVQVTGQLNGEVTASWSATSPLQAQANISLANGEVSQQLEHSTASWRWDKMTLDARHQQGSTDLAARLQQGAQQDEQAVALLDVQIDGNNGDALSGDLTLRDLQLAALRPFIPQLARLEGALAGRLALAGTARQPDVRGRLRWHQGALRLLDNPTELEQLDLQLDLQGQRMQLAGGGLLGGGEISLQGELQGLPDWALTLNVQGQSNRLLYPPSLEVVVSPDLKLTARADLVTVAGDIQVEEGRLEQDQLPEGSVQLSNDVVRVDYAGNELDEQQLFDTRIDLRLAIAERFRVLGQGLDARVGGNLEVRQRPGRPLQLYGNLNVVDGEFRAYGQHLNIRQGRVSFAGVPENPELDLRAERDISLEQVTAGVSVGGTLDAPTLQVYSDPPMSQAEALSYLVRGRGLDSGADADGTALALSLGSGILNRSALVEGLNRVPGLSNVEFGAEGSADDTAATVSGYLGERIYLSYGVGLYEPVNVLTARLYLYTRLWLEVVSRLESSVDLYYSFDIE